MHDILGFKKEFYKMLKGEQRMYVFIDESGLWWHSHGEAGPWKDEVEARRDYFEKVKDCAKKDWKSLPGFFEEEEGVAIQKVCEGKKVLEIGSLYGRSTCCISDVAEEVVSVDPHTGIEGLGPRGSTASGLFDNLSGRKNIIVHIGTAEEIVPMLPDNYFDVVLIDGLHWEPFISLDLLLSYPKLKEEGIYTIHDYYPSDSNGWPQVREVVNKVFLLERKNFEWKGNLMIIPKADLHLLSLLKHREYLKGE